MHIAVSATDIKSSHFSAHPQKNQCCWVLVGFFFFCNYLHRQSEKDYYCFLHFHLLFCLEIVISSGEDPLLCYLLKNPCLQDQSTLEACCSTDIHFHSLARTRNCKKPKPALICIWHAVRNVQLEKKSTSTAKKSISLTSETIRNSHSVFICKGVLMHWCF